MKVATMNGNIIMLPFSSVHEACEAAILAQLSQFSIRKDDDGVVLSTPVTKYLEDHIPGILHGARARAKDVEKPKPPTGPKGNPPNGGGTPGTPTIDTYTKTEAMAA